MFEGITFNASCMNVAQSFEPELHGIDLYMADLALDKVAGNIRTSTYSAIPVVT